MQKTAEPIEMPFGARTRVGPSKHVLDWGAHWRHLVNELEPSMCGGDAAFLSSDHLLLMCSTLLSSLHYSDVDAFSNCVTILLCL